MKNIYQYLVLICFSLSLYSQETQRLQGGWDFVKGDLASPWEAFRPLKRSKLPTWTQVKLPHCFNAFDAVVRVSAPNVKTGFLTLRASSK